ncbi:hypothetical protein QLG01_00490 [Acinetobacter sp. V89_4]|uniref:hypothetical protein n=1 Tax=Acinetobacter sp. V89_4 TaxID=3044232 RepID=UPI00249F7431|nr:hypothetical protein [Acinetobacter sp. V89_4]MDI3451672.1 hypothetical protein [Acinetobacter sp. V89_4]
MIDKSKLPFGLNVLELVSLMGFLSLGYSLLYKLSFYNVFGIPWYINNFTPQTLFFSSIKLIFIAFPAALFGWYLGGILKDRLIILIILNLLVSGLVSYYYFYVDINLIPINALIYLMIFFYMLNARSSYFKPKTLDNFPSKNRQKTFTRKLYILWASIRAFHILIQFIMKKFLIYFMFFACFILAPCMVGAFEAKSLLREKENLLNEVFLNNEKGKWYILDISSDKCLLINNYNDFKIVNINDIKQFKMPKKTRIL